MSNEKLDIDYVAQLARIELDGDEKELFGSQLNSVLDYFKKLDTVNVDGIEPTAHAFPLYNVWHEDTPHKPLSQEEALDNAPAQKEKQVIVPRVVE